VPQPAQGVGSLVVIHTQACRGEGFLVCGGGSRKVADGRVQVGQVAQRDPHTGIIAEGTSEGESFFEQLPSHAVLTAVVPDDSEMLDRLGDPRPVVERAKVLQRIVKRRAGGEVVVLAQCQVAEGREGVSPRVRGRPRVHEQSFQPGAPFALMPTHRPVEPPERAGQAQPVLVGIARLYGPLECRAEVLVLVLEAVDPVPLVLAAPGQDGTLGEAEAPAEVTVTNERRLLSRLELLEAKLTDRFEHSEARLAADLAEASDEAARDELLQQNEGAGFWVMGHGGRGAAGRSPITYHP
jgi:hypothetical protein